MAVGREHHRYPDGRRPTWLVSAGAGLVGMPLADFGRANRIGHDQGTLQQIFESTRDAACRIIERTRPGGARSPRAWSTSSRRSCATGPRCSPSAR
jgi:hypothetical protein